MIQDSFLLPNDLVDIPLMEKLTHSPKASGILKTLRKLDFQETEPHAVLKYINQVYQHTLSMPYRYASAQLTATEVLNAGEGMCTNKAVLSVALLRLASIRSGFWVLKYKNSAHIEKTGGASVSASIQKSTVHIAPVVWFHSRWVALDASDDIKTAKIVHNYTPPSEWYGEDVLCIDLSEIDKNLGIWHDITALAKKQQADSGRIRELNSALDRRLNS
nr:transglutaminase family protein [uncultured Cohaesibacter sp.]